MTVTPDEYEARLRDAVDDAIVAYRRQADEYDVAGAVAAYALCGVAIDAYADWLRLRAVAGQRCYRRQGIEEWDDYGDIYRDCFELRDTESPSADLCPPCTAERRMAEILAAAEVTA